MLIERTFLNLLINFIVQALFGVDVDDVQVTAHQKGGHRPLVWKQDRGGEG